MKKLLFGLMAFAVLGLGANGSKPAQAHSWFSGWHKHSTTRFPQRALPVGHLEAVKIDRFGIPVAYRDMGIGTVTNFGVASMAHDAFWAAPSGGAINTLALEKFCATGTGTTSAAATDYKLQTADAVTPVSGTLTDVSTATPAAKEQLVCTLAYSVTEAVTEWGLFNNGTLSASTGTPWTAGSASTGTATGTPYTPSSTTVQGEQQFVFSDTTKSPAICALVISNTSSVVTTSAAGWQKCTDDTASATNPANADVLAIYPVMLDHQVFPAINVVNGDSIQFTFTLTLPSGS